MQTRPMTGDEYLDSIRDGREVWIDGERVKDVTAHAAFRNCARRIAGLYDSLHDPEVSSVIVGPTDAGDGYTHRFLTAARTAAQLRASAEAVAAWARMTYGWLGRSPDYTGCLLSPLGSYPQLCEPYDDNARRWNAQAQRRFPFVGHALSNPPVDRHLGRSAVADVHLRVERETDAGLVVSGAKVVATGAVLTNHLFIGSVSPIPAGATDFACVFIVPTDAPGLKLLCRPSYEAAVAASGNAFYYPLSSQFDENDAVVVFDEVAVPWENVLCYDVDRANRFLAESGFVLRGLMHGCVRLAVKFDFLCGLLLRGVHLTGAGEQRGVQIRLGELLSYRDLFWSCVDSMVDRPVPWADGTTAPNPQACSAYRLMSTVLYPRAREIFLKDLGGSMVYTGSHGADWQQPEVRRHLDRFLRGSHGRSAEERVKLMRLIWDAVGSEFGGRQELYELNYSGPHENNLLETLRWQRAGGHTDRYEDMVERFLAECGNGAPRQPTDRIT